MVIINRSCDRRWVHTSTYLTIVLSPMTVIGRYQIIIVVFGMNNLYLTECKNNIIIWY